MLPDQTNKQTVGFNSLRFELELKSGTICRQLAAEKNNNKTEQKTNDHLIFFYMEGLSLRASALKRGRCDETFLPGFKNRDIWAVKPKIQNLRTWKQKLRNTFYMYISGEIQKDCSVCIM